MTMSIRWLTLTLAFLCLMVPGPTWAQSETATVSGIVLDETGASIPGVAITITNADTGVSLATTTISTGHYVLPSLRPGRYRMNVAKEGFKQVTLTNLVVNVQDSISRNFVLQVGAFSESTTVTAGTTAVSMSPSVSTTIDRQFVENLPLSGRTFQSLLLLTPGVVASSVSQNELGQFSVAGQRPSANYFTVDGVSANIGVAASRTHGAVSATLGGAYPGLSAFGGTNSLVSADALEEFKLHTSTYSAEFGRQPGGQISMVTRSGTNSFRGRLFHYFRHDKLDARDYFNRGPKVPLRQNQFGGTFGGPLLLPGYDARNRTFFFLSYEGQRLRQPVTGIANVPSLRLRAIASPSTRPLLDAFPQPTGPEHIGANPFTGAGIGPTGLAPFNYAYSNPARMDATSLRLDHSVNRALTLFGRFNEAPSFTSGYGGGAQHTYTRTATRTLTVGSTWMLSPRMTNMFRLNYSRQLGQLEWMPTTVNGAVPIENALLTSGLGGEAEASMFLGNTQLRLFSGDQVRNFQRQLNVVNGFTWMVGAHQLKFGFDIRRMSPTYGTQDLQAVSFTEPELISGTALQHNLIAIEATRPSFNNYSFFAQDTLRVGHRLSIDLGLRWDINPPPSERDGKVPPIAQGIVGPDVSNATLAPPGTPFYTTSYGGIAPRLGAAYQLRDSSGWETVLRGGFGVFYDLGSGAALRGYPRSNTRSLFDLPFPLPSEQAVRPTLPGTYTLPLTTLVHATEQNLRLPYSLHWNVSVEQAIGPQQAVTVSYVASAGRRLLTTQTLNLPVGGNTGPRANPNFQNISLTYNGPTSDYHSLQTQYRARFRQLQALVNYTWAHAIDEASNDLQPFFLMRGNSSFDVRHNFSSALSYQLPSPRMAGFRQVFSNWSMHGVVYVQSGRPIPVRGILAVIDGQQFMVIPDVVPGEPFYIKDPSVPGGRRFNAAAFTAPPRHPTFPATFARQGNFGRNVLREHPLYQTDMSVARSFPVANGTKVTFRWDVFNLFNHPMFGGYGEQHTIPATFGVPTQTRGRSLGGLSHLYQIGGPRSMQASLRVEF
jgi:hypothetical protein